MRHILVVFLLLFVACSEDSDVVIQSIKAMTTSLTGTVVNAETGEGLSGVSVSLGEDTTIQSAEDGHFTLQAEPGELSIRFAKEGYQSRTLDVYLETTLSLGNVTMSTLPQGPLVDDGQTLSGSGGDAVTVTGTGFSSEEGTVSIAGNMVSIDAWSENAITFRIPDTAEPGETTFIITADGDHAPGYPITILPAIHAVSPSSASAGTSLILTGVNFGASPGTLAVAGATVDTDAWTATEISFVLPAHIDDGAQTVTVANGGQSSQPFGLTIDPLPPMRIHHRSPDHLAYAEAITLYGVSFGANPGSVAVAGVDAEISSWTDGEVVVELPVGIPQGYTPIQLTTAESVTSNTVSVVVEGSDVWVPVGAWLRSRIQTSAVWTGSEMIVWGGYVDSDSSRIESQTGERYNPITDTWMPLPVDDNTPSDRRNHAMVWTGEEMIVFGGHWGINYWYYADGAIYSPQSDSWRSMASLAYAERRSHASAVWTGSEMLVWGGKYEHYSGSAREVVMQSSGWRYDPQSDEWSAMSQTNVPSGRVFHSAVWTGADMLVFGGQYDVRSDYNTVTGGYFEDGARYNPSLDEWTSLPLGPSARSRHATVWTGNEMLVHSGYGATGYIADGWSLQPGAEEWEPLPQTDAPEARRDAQSAWTGNEFVVWGGRSDTTNYLGQGSAYSPSSGQWRAVTDTSAPAGRVEFQSVWTGDEFIVWGGQTASDTYASGGGRWTPSDNTWRSIDMDRSTVSSLHDLSIVWTGSEVLIFGGRQNWSSSSTGLHYDPVAHRFTAMGTAGDFPISRHNHAAVWTGTEMLIWGGSNNSMELFDGAGYDPLTKSWSAIASAAFAQRRNGAYAFWTGDEMLIWGGTRSSEGNLFDGLRYGPDCDCWSEISAMPVERIQPLVDWAGDRLIVWSGRNASWTGQNDGYEYHISDATWKPIPVDGNTPTWATGRTAAWSGEEFIVLGGYARSGGGAYDPQAGTWRVISTPSAMYSRYDHAMRSVDGEILIYGGTNEQTHNGFVYTPATGQWRSFSPGPFQPDFRKGWHHVAVDNGWFIYGGGGQSAIYRK